MQIHARYVWPEPPVGSYTVLWPHQYAICLHIGNPAGCGRYNCPLTKRSSNGDGFCSQYSARHKGQASMTGQNSRIVRILICLHRSSAYPQCLKNHILESPGINSLAEEMCGVVDDDVVTWECVHLFVYQHMCREVQSVSKKVLILLDPGWGADLPQTSFSNSYILGPRYLNWENLSPFLSKSLPPGPGVQEIAWGQIYQGPKYARSNRVNRMLLEPEK